MGVSIIVMGVSGTGKSTVARALADRIGAEFIEGDDLHSQDNLEKMESGIPLKDEDRYPWLEICNRAMRTFNEQGKDAVLTCSSLKSDYRDVLAKDCDAYFVYLKISKEESLKRVNQRVGHFMPTCMVESQFEALEEPEPGERTIIIESDRALDQVVEEVSRRVQRNVLGDGGK
ncbi:gluconokinase [Neokomagataea thailandica NBRC 106555]|uniref:Gluconokinase n=2 Tax=Neokomagataea TaxID=1223423 RepID=A0A4Y6VAM7_9PROT|nr:MULTISPECIES: gluconokinase [Neokomagataea]QDH25415.1 gluconokinase [Neokomagataea tanensis]GBR54362.1 gluconokinase [Neokomagataea thailandica NBRC 106555]